MKPAPTAFISTREGENLAKVGQVNLFQAKLSQIILPFLVEL